MAVHNVCLPPSVLVFVRVQAWVSHTHTHTSGNKGSIGLAVADGGFKKKKGEKKKGTSQAESCINWSLCVCVRVLGVGLE